ncbi:Probable CCR4-associated factor 1 homolog 11 [Striga hermonthica]|uniref:Probable CCR4-associated factor 1 homolog 11 n=1 Tax=Striga hermonthica TaxID=68872 RepID=A0A9N7MVH2_STRHE|nr:Probable CCR4-associated factor 1 homolog 11 [Striga hermonthica]
MMAETPIIVRQVYEYNADKEFQLIQQCLPFFPLAALDTEFPGTIYHPPDGLVPGHLLPPAAFYSLMKKNIDALNLIQIGLTLSDAAGNLPSLGTHHRYIWQFNLCDFDRHFHPHDPKSISLLQRQGIDFDTNRLAGIHSIDFGNRFWSSGLADRSFGPVSWITFHGPYDLGFLIKALSGGQRLPENLHGFLHLVSTCFGTRVYDVKSMIGSFGLHGGLERVAKSLNLGRAAGRSHQAGSDSLLTMHVFLELRRRLLEADDDRDSKKWLNHSVYGLGHSGLASPSCFRRLMLEFV